MKTRTGHFCHIHFAKYRNMYYKIHFLYRLFGHVENKQYFCIVFFMVLDLRLRKGWVVGMTIHFFYPPAKVLLGIFL